MINISKKHITYEEIIEECNEWRKKEFIPNRSYNSPRISSEYPDCSLPFSFDQYSLCQYCCNYCFAYCFKVSNPTMQNKIELKAVNFKSFKDMFTGKKKDNPYWEHFIKDRKVLQWGGLADPFCGFENQHGVGKDIIKLLGDLNYPCRFSYKGDTIFKYLPLFEKYKEQKNFSFISSIITTDKGLASKIEVGVPSPSRRYESLKILKDMGYWTVHRLRPFIVGLSDETLDDMLEMDKKCVNAVSVEFYALDLRVPAYVHNRYKWMGDLLGFDNMVDYYRKLSPTSRGSYLRLNRKVKEGWIKKMYSFCNDNGLVFACSDPDFKELNHTPSCCGLPIEFPGNPSICNYSKNQQTNLLRSVRKRVWENNGDNSFEIHFEDIFKFEEVWDFYRDRKLFGEGIENMGTPAGKVVNMDFIKSLRMSWNNLYSPRNPSIYFQGKIIPVGYDGNDNIIYKYKVHPYEKRWLAEGIDLTK